MPTIRSYLAPLKPTDRETITPGKRSDRDESAERPFIMGLDVGSVSVKGVVIDKTGRILRQDYRLSRSRPIEAHG